MGETDGTIPKGNKHKKKPDSRTNVPRRRCWDWLVPTWQRVAPPPEGLAKPLDEGGMNMKQANSMYLYMWFMYIYVRYKSMYIYVIYMLYIYMLYIYM